MTADRQRVVESLRNIAALARILIKSDISGLIPSSASGKGTSGKGTGGKGARRHNADSGGVAGDRRVADAQHVADAQRVAGARRDASGTGRGAADSGGIAGARRDAGAQRVAVARRVAGAQRDASGTGRGAADSGGVDVNASGSHTTDGQSIWRRAGGPRSGGGGGRRTVLLVLLAICFMPAIMLFSVIAWQFISASKALGLDHILIGIYFTAIALMSFTLGIYHLINAFYLSRDTECLLPLPLRPYEILFAKFISALAFEMLIDIFMLLPGLVIYGIITGTPVYWVYATVVFLLFPITPLLLASIIAFLLKPLIAGIRNTDAVASVLNVLILVIVLSISLFSSRSSALIGLSQDRIMEMLVNGDAAVFGAFTRIIPSIRFAALALARNASLSGFVYLLLFLLVNAAFVAVFGLLGRLFFANGLPETRQNFSGAAKQFDAGAISKTGNASATIQIALKELRILVRTPAFLMNCVTSSLIVPIIFAVTFIMPVGTTGGGGGAGAGDAPGTLRMQIAALSASLGENPFSRLVPFILGIGYALGVFFGSISPISPTAFSRDGKDFFVNKYLPLKFKQILWGKLIPVLCLGGFEIALIAALFTAVSGFPARYTLAALPAAAAGLLQQGFTGLTVDLAMPKLNWESETAAVKRNFNVVINLAISFATGALMIIAPIVIAPMVGPIAAIAIVAALAAALALTAWLIVSRFVGPRCFRAIL